MGNFGGYLIKFNGDLFPHKYIILGTYKVTPDRMLDMDSNRNANGKLVRNVLDHTATTLEFELKPMNGDAQEEVSAFLNNHYTDKAHKKTTLEYWAPNASAYKTGEFYVPDVEYVINRIEGSQIYYASVIIKAVEY